MNVFGCWLLRQLIQKQMTANGQGFAMLDILQMKNNINPKWQVATKPMLGGEANSWFLYSIGRLLIKINNN